jgi:hypothetical protein
VSALPLEVSVRRARDPHDPKLLSDEPILATLLHQHSLPARIHLRRSGKGVRELDLTDAEAEKLGGRQVARRGRRPRAQAA